IRPHRPVRTRDHLARASPGETRDSTRRGLPPRTRRGSVPAAAQTCPHTYLRREKVLRARTTRSAARAAREPTHLAKRTSGPGRAPAFGPAGPPQPPAPLRLLAGLQFLPPLRRVVLAVQRFVELHEPFERFGDAGRRCRRN